MARPQGTETDDSLSGLRARLLDQRPVLATFLMVPRVEVIEMLAGCGFEAVIFDLEHGPLEISDLLEVAAVARGCGLHAIARLADSSPPGISRALDAGVDGILVPHVGTSEEAAALVAAGRFAPNGDRSLNPYTRGLHYGQGIGAGPDGANRRVALMAMLEGEGPLTSLEAICATDGLDGVFIGPVDLSASLGVPGQPEHPKVIDALREAFARAEASGAATGTYAHTPEAGARWSGAGARLIALSADAAMMQRGFSSFVAEAAIDAASPNPRLVVSQSRPDSARPIS